MLRQENRIVKKKVGFNKIKIIMTHLHLGNQLNDVIALISNVEK